MLRIGVIGLGEVAQVVHLPVLAALPHLFEVRSACDLSPILVQQVGNRFAIQIRHASATDLMAASDIDAGWC